MTSQPPYIVVTPVRDEKDYVERTIESMLGQTHRPLRWVVVDDGSKDGTSQLLDDRLGSLDWVTVVHRADRGFRAAGGGVVDAFYAGFDPVANLEWEFVVKLDGDLSFAPDYFSRCFDRFEREPELGIGGGIVCSLDGAQRRVDSVGDPRFHVRGATKIYRRECWNQIAPLIRAPGWDTLDEVRANFFGWRTETFQDLDVIQHKPTGSAAGTWSNSFKNGRANYITGYHPAFMAAKCVKRLFRKPYVVEAVGMGAGFVSGYVKRLPQLADADTIRYLRRQQVRRLLLQPSIYD